MERKKPKEPPKNRPNNKLWSYSVGDKGINRIRVYEIYPGSPLHVEWHDDDGRQKQSFKSLVKQTIKDKDVAVRLAKKMAEGQAEKRKAAFAEEWFGRPQRRTVKELLEAYHDALWDEWAETYQRDQKRFQARWLEWLGEGTAITDVTASLVEKRVKKAAGKEEWSKRTIQAHLRYIVDAYKWAQKRKWITERHTLTDVTIPKVHGESRPYSSEEWAKLRSAWSRVDLRCAAVAEIAYATGRRLNAIRTLRVSNYRVETVDGEEMGVLHFPGSTDKARKSGDAPLTSEAREMVERLLQSPAVQATGLLFPFGDLQDADPERGMIHGKRLTEFLWEAERLAKVEHVHGRAYHGLKRRSVTDLTRATGDVNLAGKQSGTNPQTLTRTYEQDELGPKVAAVKKLERKQRA